MIWAVDCVDKFSDMPDKVLKLRLLGGILMKCASGGNSGRKRLKSKCKPWIMKKLSFACVTKSFPHPYPRFIHSNHRFIPRFSTFFPQGLHYEKNCLYLPSTMDVTP